MSTPSRGTASSLPVTSGADEHDDASRAAQRRADKWMIAGALCMGMWIPGLIGFPIFMRGVWLQRQALRAGLSVRPMIVTLIVTLVPAILYSGFIIPIPSLKPVASGTQLSDYGVELIG